jgi:hypothetical protein
MGASFRLRFEIENLNRIRLDAPTICQLGHQCLADAVLPFRFLSLFHGSNFCPVESHNTTQQF